MGWREQLKARQEKKASQNIKTFKVPDGKTLMRILPNKEDADAPFFHDFGQHWIKSTEKNAQGQNKITSAPLCLKKAYEENCPYCEAISEAMGQMEGNEHHFSDEEVELVKGAVARHRILVNAAVRQDRAGNYKIEVVELASTAFDALINVMDEWGEEILSPKGGMDVVIERSGKGINTKYTVSIPKNGGNDIDDSWTEEVVDLDAFVRSQKATPERHNKAISTIGTLAGLSLASEAPAIEAKAETKKLSSPPSEAVTDQQDIDILEDEIEELPDTDGDAPFATDDVVEAEVVESSADDDLLAELDELDNL